MDFISDPSLKLKYDKSKFKVKRWESDFKDKTGTFPSKDDIKKAPSEIREAYKWYWQIKIHSLGQDSMLDATFLEKRKSESPVSTADDSSQLCDSSRISEKDLVSVDAAGKGELVLSNHSEGYHSEPPVGQEGEEKINADKEPATDVTSSPVWGSHLNLKKEQEHSTKRKNLNRSSSSFQLSEKLFVGAKLKKRNPRKSISFSTSKAGWKSGLLSSDSLLTTSDSSFSQENSQGLEDGFSVSEFEKDQANDMPDKKEKCNFVVVKKVASSLQPVSVVQRVMEDDTKPLKPRAERNLDKGWLDRVMQVDQIWNLDPQTNHTLCSKENPHSAKPLVSDESDDDIIYGSDSEIISPRKAAKEEKARLALRSTSIKEPSSNYIVKDLDSDASKPNASENHNGNEKKRKLDAMEAAMAVLSKRQKSDENHFQTNKNCTRVQSGDVKSQDIVDHEENENKKDLNPDQIKSRSKPGMSKKEVLEKKVAAGTVNDNFIRINLKKKVYVRGKKTMNYQKYKKQQWKNKKKELSDQTCAYLSRFDPSDSAAGGGLQKCFKCGDVGHFARQCTQNKGESLMPQGEDDEIEESPFPSLEDVEKMAREKSEFVHYRQQNYSDPKPDDSSSSGDTTAATQMEDQVADVLREPGNDERRFGTVEPLYSLNPDGSLMETPSEVYDCLRQFGHENFRPGQEVAVMRILSGLSTLVTLSTGSGKSLCYQLPAYLFAKKKKCITLVVSPLVSLMDDQVSGLPPFINAAALHTAQTEKQREKVMVMAKSGKLQFLLVSPEAIVAGEKKNGFGGLLRELPDIAFACIDEAHCVSQWSHNFRPSYLVLFKVLREKLGIKTVLGLTATATQPTVSCIIEQMQITDGRNGVVQDMPLPENLLLSVSRDINRDKALLTLLCSNEFKDYKSIIIYCTRQAECERIACLLRTGLKTNETIPGKKKINSIAEAYHAGLSATRRKQIQEAFMSDNLRIVVATVAFGMGINKPDIRSVIHFNMPHNFESYVQEVGRAGRDGEVSHCHLFLSSEGKDLNELRRHIFADSVDRHTLRKLLQRVYVPCKCARSEDEQKLQVCIGHEVAFSVDETVAALDLPEPNITTLLCYLELYDQSLLKVMPKAYTNCRIMSCKGMKHIQDVAKSCPPLAMAIAMKLMSGKSLKNSHSIEFPVVEIASAIGWDSGIVKRELMNLEWTKVNNSTRRSGIKVELSDLGFRVKAPGNLSPERLDSTLDFLHDRVLKQEKCALISLKNIFEAVTSVSFESVTSMMEVDPCGIKNQSDALKKVVRSYFQEEQIIQDTLESEEKLDKGEQIANDIRQMVNMYRECSFTGRAVARIFHGIGSPNFPPQVWGRCRFWRAHLDSDFKLICLLATRILINMR